jgi:probable HAF family extracellular repeat protein
MGALDGGNDGTIGGINIHGEVVGASINTNASTELAYLFSHGEMKSLGTLGGTISQAFSINDGGEVVGLSTIAPGNNQGYLFLYRHGQMTNLGAGNFSKPVGNIQINNHGDMIAFALSDGDASLIRRGKVVDVGSLAGLGSQAVALNNKDEVAGLSQISGSSADPTYHAFLYENGKMIDLGTLGGSSSQGNGINNHGEVVGSLTTARGAIHGFFYKNGRMTDIGSLGGGQTEAFGINDSGEIVGDSANQANAPNGFLYERGKMMDLNAMIPTSARTEFTVIDAEAINNRGQIAALAVSTNLQDRSEYVVLLTPK